MTACARVILVGALAACASRTPTARERALEQLPANAQVIAAADGPMLASATFRKVIDGTRGKLPSDLGCVIDTALTSEAVAVAVDTRVGTTIVVVTRAFVGNCDALSKIGNDRYVATIGGGSLVSDRKQSVLGDPQWAWARDYLVSNPVAIAAELPARRMLAVAQPDPLDGWVAIDALEPTTVDKQLNELAARWRREGWSKLGTKLKTQRSGAQVIARLDKPEVDDVIALVNELTRDDASAAGKSPELACPPVSDSIKSCDAQTHKLVVASTKQMLESMTRVDVEPMIDSGDIAGVRLLSDAHQILRKGDIILGMDSRRVGSQEQLDSMVEAVGPTATLAIRRDGADLSVTISQQ